MIVFGSAGIDISLIIQSPPIDSWSYKKQFDSEGGAGKNIK